MANLLNQDVALNYRGILNLGATINTPLDSTLRSVTDGMGNASTLQLSTTLAAISSNLAVGTTTASARLQVRGDGTNPIARFESSTGSQAILINSLGDTIYGSNNFINIRANLQGGSGPAVSIGSFNSLNATSGTQWVAETIGTFASGAGSSVKYLHAFNYTINNSGAQTGTAIGLFLNATETALNGMAHNLMDLQVNGASKIRVNNIGVLTTEYGITGNNPGSSFQINGRWSLSGTGLGELLVQPWSGSALIVKLGGTTNAFPAIKRNGAAIDFRLADDSAFCNLNTGILSIQNIVTSAAAIASTHKVTISIGGTTYYLLASNV